MIHRARVGEQSGPSTITCERQIAGAIEISRRWRVITTATAKASVITTETRAEDVRTPRAADHQADTAERDDHRESGAA